MAEKSWFQSVAHFRWPAALHSGNGRFAVVVRFKDRTEVTLCETFTDADMLAAICAGRVIQLPLQVSCNETFGYRERAQATA
jgi:porphobilinogen deaminase